MSDSDDESCSYKESKYWMFTYNNPTEDFAPEYDLRNYQFMCYQFELGTLNGTPHYQGYVCFNEKIRFSTLKNRYEDRYSWRSRMGTHNEAKHYCSKPHKECECKHCKKERAHPTKVDGTYEEHGDDTDIPPDKSGRGKRNDLSAVKDAIKDGMSLENIRWNYPEVYARYHKWVKECIEDIKEKKEIIAIAEDLKDEPDFPWFKEAEEKLLNQCKRNILWITSNEGNKGKSLWAKKMESNYGIKRVFLPDYKKGVKTEGLAHIWDSDQDIVIFDIPRDVKHIPYSLIECFKNGRITDTKYEGRLKRKVGVKVAVVTNQKPDYTNTKFSKDRFDIIELK